MGWMHGGIEAEREEKLRQHQEKIDVYESNFAALRAKQEVARVKYAREKECKALFSAAASAAMARGFGSNVFNEDVFARCERGITMFPPLPDWQKRVAVPPPKATDCEPASEHCKAQQSNEAELCTRPAVHGIDELYKFTESVKDGEDE